ARTGLWEPRVGNGPRRPGPLRRTLRRELNSVCPTGERNEQRLVRACRSDRRTLAEMERHIPRPRWAENQVISIGYAERAALVLRQAPGNGSGPVTGPYWRPPGPFLLSPGSHAGHNGGAETMKEPHDPNLAAGNRSAAARSFGDFF